MLTLKYIFSGNLDLLITFCKTQSSFCFLILFFYLSRKGNRRVHAAQDMPALDSLRPSEYDNAAVAADHEICSKLGQEMMKNNDKATAADALVICLFSNHLDLLFVSRYTGNVTLKKRNSLETNLNLSLIHI